MVKLGQDVSEVGCVLAVFRAIKELRHAIKNDDRIHAQFFDCTTDIMTDKEFVAAYCELLFGTVQDRVADVKIALATSRYVFKGEDTYAALRSAALRVLPNDVIGDYEFELKMRFNELIQG